MANCNTPAQTPCGPGPYQSPICYTVPPSQTVLPGLKEITLNADCSLDTSTILDSGGTPVPGAVEAPCAGACTDCAGQVAQPITVQDEGAVVDTGATCLNFVGPGVTAAVVGACVNVTIPGGGVPSCAGVAAIFPPGAPTPTDNFLVHDPVGVSCRQITPASAAALIAPFLPGPTFPLLAPSGTCAAPSYSFTAEPNSGLLFEPGVPAVTLGYETCSSFVRVGTEVRIEADNGDFINLGASIAVTAVAGDLNLVSSLGDVTLSADNLLTVRSLTDDINIHVGAGAGTRIFLDIATSSINIVTATLSRLMFSATGEWLLAGLSGIAGQVITSAGAGAPPTWTTLTAVSVGANQVIAVQDAGITEVTNPSTLNFDAGFVVTPAGAVAEIDLDYGAPVATAQANADGVATTVARSDHVHRTIVQVQDAGVLIGSRPTLNFIDGANVTITVADNAGLDRVDITIAASGGGGAFIQRFTFQADQLDTPNNANWAVNALAPAAADSVNNAIVVRRFDDTTEEGVGGMVTVPTGAVNVTFYFKWRAQTAPGVAVGVVLTYYTRTIPDNAVVTAWSAAVNFTTLTVPTNANFQYDSQTISLATLGWTVGNLHQFEITRRGTQGGDTLTGDFDLTELILEFTT